MFYAGQRHAVPSSRYGAALDVMDAMHWTWQEYNGQPWDLVEEAHVRIAKRALAEKPKRIQGKKNGVKGSA